MAYCIFAKKIKTLITMNFILKKMPEILFGSEKRNEVFSILEKEENKHILLIADPFFKEHDFVRELKKEYAEKLSVFSDIAADPSIENAMQAVQEARNSKADVVIAIGGGSALDIAKVVAVMLTNSADIYEIIGVNKIKNPPLPLIVLPTTAGTGTEVTPISILSDTQKDLKLGIVSPHLIPAIAILDPELSLTLPPQQTAYSGMDALIHAMEAYTSLNATLYTDILAEKAIQFIAPALPELYKNPENLALRSELLFGSLLAGQAFANAGVAAVHAFSYPIGAKYHIPHGLANCLMLLPVLSFNTSSCAEKYVKIAQWIDGGDSILQSMDILMQKLNIPRRISDFGAKEADITALSAAVLKVERLLNNNPRTLNLEEAKQLYRSVL